MFLHSLYTVYDAALLPCSYSAVQPLGSSTSLHCPAVQAHKQIQNSANATVCLFSCRFNETRHVIKIYISTMWLGCSCCCAVVIKLLHHFMQMRRNRGFSLRSPRNKLLPSVGQVQQTIQRAWFQFVHKCRRVHKNWML